MSKRLSAGAKGKECHAYKIKLICEYLCFGKPLRKEAIIEVTTTSRDIAEKIAIEKAERQLKEFSYIKDILITVMGRKKK